MNLEGKIALITGASRGIGAAVARKYASLGCHVILVARNVQGLEKVDDLIKQDGKGAATLVPLDLQKTDQIDQLVLSVAEKFGKLDILVGNAAILGGLRPIAQVTNKVWDQVMAINVTANHRLIRNFDPLLQKSDNGRAMFVSTGIAGVPRPFWGVYSISKGAMETLVKTYAAEVGDTTNVKANIIDPGICRTNMRAAAYPGEDPDELISPEEITDVFVHLASDDLQENGQVFKAADYIKG